MSLEVWKIDSIRWRIGARCGPLVGLVFASWADDPRVECGEFGVEVLGAEVLIADQGEHLPAGSLAAGDDREADELLVDFWGGQRERSRGAVRGELGVQAKPPGSARCTGVFAAGGFPRALAMSEGDQITVARWRLGRSKRRSRGLAPRTRRPEVVAGGGSAVICDGGSVSARGVPSAANRARAQGGDQRLNLAGEPQPALVQRVTGRQAREQMRELSARAQQEPGIGGLADDRLRDPEGDDLRIGDPATRIAACGRQEIVRDAVNRL